jgi:hypothetical protein
MREMNAYLGGHICASAYFICETTEHTSLKPGTEESELKLSTGFNFGSYW